MITLQVINEEGLSGLVSSDVIMTDAHDINPNEKLKNLQDNLENENDKNWIKTASYIKRYKVSIRTHNLEITEILKKLQLIQQKVGHNNDFLSIKLFNY